MTTNNLKLFKQFCERSVQAKDVDPTINYMKYIVERTSMNKEQVIFLCFLYGLTYQLPTAFAIWSRFPDLELVNRTQLTAWFDKYQKRLPFQQDKIKSRRFTVDTILSYQSIVGPNQKKYFDELLSSDNPQTNFDKMWYPLKSTYRFGRFSTWNQCQVLKHVARYNVEPTKLMLGEPDSVSFTDGLAYAFGLFDKLTKKVVDPLTGKKKKIYYKWTEVEKQQMESECTALKCELGLDNFQLETLACAFKKIWRTNDSRYVGYYNDRLADDIRKTELCGWNGIEWKLLWDARTECVPSQYLHSNIGINRDWFKLTPEQKVML